MKSYRRIAPPTELASLPTVRIMLRDDWRGGSKEVTPIPIPKVGHSSICLFPQERRDIFERMEKKEKERIEKARRLKVCKEFIK